MMTFPGTMTWCCPQTCGTCPPTASSLTTITPSQSAALPWQPCSLGTTPSGWGSRWSQTGYLGQLMNPACATYSKLLHQWSISLFSGSIMVSPNLHIFLVASWQLIFNVGVISYKLKCPDYSKTKGATGIKNFFLLFWCSLPCCRYTCQNTQAIFQRQRPSCRWLAGTTAQLRKATVLLKNSHFWTAYSGSKRVDCFLARVEHPPCVCCQYARRMPTCHA